MSGAALVREIFPDAPEEWLDYALWEYTAFPLTTDEADIRKSLLALKARLEEKKLKPKGKKKR